MPRGLIYKNERVKPSIRIDKELYVNAQERAKSTNKNFQKYIIDLIEEDLMFAETQKRKELYKMAKEQSDENNKRKLSKS